MKLPESDLSRAKTSEPNHNWPDEVRIVVRRGQKSKSHVITADEYFGMGAFHAPMNGDSIMRIIDTLRRL